MFPLIQISENDILSTYNLLVGGALIAALLTFFALSKKTGISKATADRMTILFAIMVPLAGLSAALLNNFEHDRWVFSSPGAFISGFTFYGGLIGGGAAAIVGCCIIGRRQKQCLLLLDLLAVSLMLGHAVGRLGCFFGGCCYGRATDSLLGIPYPIHGEWVRVYPVQLYESLFLFLLFLYSRRHIAYALERYLLAYGVFRFLIEFLRGDDRGNSVILSPSQWISIVLILTGLVLSLLRKRSKQQCTDEEPLKQFS